MIWTTQSITQLNTCRWQTTAQRTIIVKSLALTTHSACLVMTLLNVGPPSMPRSKKLWSKSKVSFEQNEGKRSFVASAPKNSPPKWNCSNTWKCPIVTRWKSRSGTVHSSQSRVWRAIVGFRIERSYGGTGWRISNSQICARIHVPTALPPSPTAITWRIISKLIRNDCIFVNIVACNLLDPTIWRRTSPFNIRRLTSSVMFVIYVRHRSHWSRIYKYTCECTRKRNGLNVSTATKSMRIIATWNGTFFGMRARHRTDVRFVTRISTANLTWMCTWRRITGWRAFSVACVGKRLLKKYPWKTIVR